MSLRRRKARAAIEQARRERVDAAAKDGHINRSVEDQLIERLKRMKLPEPPSGTKERGLARYHEHLRSQGRQPWR